MPVPFSVQPHKSRLTNPGILPSNPSTCTILAQGWTPLQLAAKAGDAEAIKVLLEAGAAIEAEDVSGRGDPACMRSRGGAGGQG
jgi:hypothetical protein